MDESVKAGIVFVLGIIVIAALGIFVIPLFYLWFAFNVATFLGVVVVVLGIAGTVAATVYTVENGI